MTLCDLWQAASSHNSAKRSYHISGLNTFRQQQYTEDDTWMDQWQPAALKQYFIPEGHTRWPISDFKPA